MPLCACTSDCPRRRVAVAVMVPLSVIALTWPLTWLVLIEPLAVCIAMAPLTLVAQIDHVGVSQHEIAGDASCLKRARRGCDIRARVPWYRHVEVHPCGQGAAIAIVNRDGDGNHVSPLPVARVNGIGYAIPVLCDAHLAIRAVAHMLARLRVDEPQHHLVVNLKDPGAWCRTARRRGDRWPGRDGRARWRPLARHPRGSAAAAGTARSRLGRQASTSAAKGPGRRRLACAWLRWRRRSLRVGGGQCAQAGPLPCPIGQVFARLAGSSLPRCSCRPPALLRASRAPTKVGGRRRRS